MKHIFTVFLLFFTIATQAQVGIGTTTPDASARLQVDANASTNAKGFLPPRVTATERAGVVSPATGLIVYQTDGTKGFYYYDGTAWNLLTINTSTVPYTGAIKSVDLGAYDLTVNGITLGTGAGNILSNTASGYQALYSNTTGAGNNASGYQALYANTTGSDNTASGYQALYSNTTGNQNIASGSNALRSNTTGSYNIANGYNALYANTIGSYNTASGYKALFNNTVGYDNIASGFQALFSNTEGIRNIATGYQSLYSNTTGSYNTASGYKALFNNTVGYDNIASGYQALYSNSTGSYNTALGYGAGFYVTTGSNNILLGNNAQASSATVSNEITLGNTSITTLRCKVTSITSLSDRRDKTDIIPIVEGLAFLKQLNPVSFTWNTRDKAKVGIKSAGFIAQELLALQKQSDIGDNLDLVSENNPEKLEARYGNLLPVIVKAIQEESAEKDLKIKVLNEKLDALEKDKVAKDLRLDALEKQITQLLNK